MITWSFSITSQKKRYKEVRKKLKSGFYQNLKFYVLPFMPEKFRSRIVIFPNVCEPEKIYRKQKHRLNSIESNWYKSEPKFLKQVHKVFPKVHALNITISPSLYGTMGSYYLSKGKIKLTPRYDRSLVDIQKLLITALTHYFHFGYTKKFTKPSKNFVKKQLMSSNLQVQIMKSKKPNGLIKILNTRFAGKLAEKSAAYLSQLGLDKTSKLNHPANLTKKERLLYTLLLTNKNKLASFDLIANTIWGEKTYDNYSEYAITKLVERLKKKLPKNSIHSQRGQGYLLYS